MAFIDAHRGELGIEPICRELAIAPSSYHEHATRLADPCRRSARARRDDEIRQEISRVHETSFGLYGTCKVWHQLRRQGTKVAKCTVERLMQSMGLTGIRRGKKTITTVSNPVLSARTIRPVAISVHSGENIADGNKRKTDRTVCNRIRQK